MSDHFEATHLEPKVEVCNRRYVFDAQQPPKSPKPIVFDPIGKCPAFVVNPAIARPAREKQRDDEVQYAQLVKANVSVAPIHSGLDGGMNRVFLAQVGGSIPPARVPPSGSRPPQTPSIRPTAPWGGKRDAHSSHGVGVYSDDDGSAQAAAIIGAVLSRGKRKSERTL